MLVNISQMQKDKCCGCRACEQICPKNCIMMKVDSEGFIIPVVDETVCINCGLCVQRCAQIERPMNEEKIQEVYAARHKNKRILLRSTSGGIFDAIGRFLLKQGYHVYGCAWSIDLHAVHVEINEEKELQKLHGSKYVQSDTNDTYSKVKAQLREGEYVLYSGTACQIGGLIKFLGKNYINLYTIDVICHGVPSPLLFENYLEWLSQRLGENVISYDFRNKEKTAWGLVYKAKTKTKTKTKFLTAYLDPYYKAFLECKTYRECCYSCKYANENRVSDITLGDYWGIERQHPEFFDDRGVSVLIVNSNKGKLILEAIRNQIEFITSSYQQAALQNSNLISPSFRPSSRDNIYQYIKIKEGTKIFEKQINIGFEPLTRFKSIIPLKIKRWFKTIGRRGI